MVINALRSKPIGSKVITERLRLWKHRKNGKRQQKSTQSANKPAQETNK